MPHLAPQSVRLVLLAVAACLVLYWVIRRPDLLRLLAESLEDIRDRFGGGPPSASHPLPGDDGAVVLRRKRAPRAGWRF